MNTITYSASPISYKGNYNHSISDKTKDKSTAMTIGGGAGVATFGTISQSSKIGTNMVKVINNSKHIKADQQAKILSILEHCKPLAGLAKNPIVKKVAGGL